jgi:hypothetical protein
MSREDTWNVSDEKGRHSTEKNNAEDFFLAILSWSDVRKQETEVDTDKSLTDSVFKNTTEDIS